MRNVKFIVEYDGTKYSGWQRQENAVTVQEKIEGVLSKILQEDITVAGAGRTDAGVHARGQAGNFHTASGMDLFNLKGGVNGLLPHDIVIHDVQEAPAEFHARHSALEREYSYTITRKETALLRMYSWYLKYNLNPDVMKAIAASIVGAHSFEAFCKVQTETEQFRCNVSSAEWKEAGPLLIFTIRADHFLHGMVRTLVGTMVDIGRGYTPAEHFPYILERKDRKEAGMAAPAKGLVLERVLY